MKRILRWVHTIRRLVWKILKPTSKGARALLISNGQVLLVKHTYEDYWYIPGGKVNKYELYEDAIKRELEEEVGAIIGQLDLFGVYNNFYENKDDTVVIFVTHDFELSEKKNIEIEAFQLFDLNDLPEEISPGSKRRIDEYIKAQMNDYGKW